MENEQNKLVLLAEDILISEESKLNPIFLTVDVKLCDSVLNSNREGVTEAFIADVIERQNDHVCLPFYADVKNLLAGNYDQLGHLYNRATKKFGTSMIGSMSEFYAETNEYGVVSLMGKIKIPKRDRDIVDRVVDLYEMGHFAVSVELSYDPRELVVAQGGKFIDVSEHSALTGLCLVWRPACSDATALDMVASVHADDSVIVADSEEQGMRGETRSMDDKKELTAEVEEEAVAVEEQQVEAEPETEAVEESVVAEDATAEAGDGGADAEGDGADTEDGADDAGDDQSDDAEEDGPVEDDRDEKRVSEQANAEVIENSVDIHEGLYECPETGETVHVVETRERFVETIEAQEQTIAELKTRIAELEEIEGKYNSMIAEREAAELAEKKVQAKAFAEKQGLDVTVAEVQDAIENLDYTAIAEMTMAQEQSEEEKADEPAAPAITLASFVDLEVSDDNAYGGLLKPRSK